MKSKRRKNLPNSWIGWSQWPRTEHWHWGKRGCGIEEKDVGNANPTKGRGNGDYHDSDWGRRGRRVWKEVKQEMQLVHSSSYCDDSHYCFPLFWSLRPRAQPDSALFIALAPKEDPSQLSTWAFLGSFWLFVSTIEGGAYLAFGKAIFFSLKKKNKTAKPLFYRVIIKFGLLTIYSI